MKAFNHNRLFLLLSLFILLTACAHRTQPPQDSSDAIQDTRIPEMTLTDNLGKTIAEFPIDANAQVHADYDENKNIIVYFTPAVTEFDTALDANSLISRIEKGVENGKMSSMTFHLNSEAKFLLSMQSDTTARLMLVSDEASTPQLPTNYISSLSFKPKGDALLVLIYSSFPFEVTPRQGEAFLLNLGKAQFTEQVLKKYDLTQLGIGIQSATAINGEDGNAYLSFDGVRNPELSLLRKGDETAMLVKRALGSTSAILSSSDGLQQLAPPPVFADQQSNIIELNTLLPGMKERYTGEKISIDLQNAEVEHVLRLISEISGYNLILDDAVTGRISLKLVDIPWDQALDLVLIQRNLGMVLKGNIMRIASTIKLEEERAQLQKAREAAIQAQESMQNLAPLHTEYLQINYSTAAEFEGKVKTMISPRGSVSSDPRTNILIVTDTEESLRRVNSYIKKLDRAERQVMIEARIVYATDEFQRTLGVQWSSTYSPETASNIQSEQWRGDFKTTGMNFINTANTIALGGSIGKYLGKDLFSLDAQLRLGESNNLVKTVSAPRILTLNNNRAEIQQGTKLATATESQSGGTTTEYEEAVLKISVLPQITPDDKLILDLEISDDTPKSDGRDIDTKQTKTKMMVGDRETIVIGGVLKSTETSGVNQIPGLGDVPGLGWLFKNKYDTKNKAELLIFIQPRIL